MTRPERPAGAAAPASRGRGRRLILALFFISACTAASGQDRAPLVVSPTSWDFGFVRRGEDLTAKVVVSNRGRSPLSVTLIPTCGCLTVEPAALSLAPDSRATVNLSFDTSSYSGEVTKSMVIGAPGVAPIEYSVHGIVKGAERLGASSGSSDESAAAEAGTAARGGGQAGAGPYALRVAMTYYYAPGCRTCERFLSEEIPRLERSLGMSLSVRTRDVLGSEAYEELAALAASRGTTLKAIPVMDVEGRLLQGEEEISAQLSVILAAAASGGPAAAAVDEGTPVSGAAAGSPGSPAPPSVLEGLAVLPVLAGGLLDGVNPCAFTTLIFLLASLALAGRGRREVLAIGALFSTAVFLTYLGIGLGLFAALRAAATFSLVSMILRWLLVAALLVFAALSVYDVILIRRGRPTEILLQLPTVLKRRIHASIRTRMKAVALAGSSLALGFLVSIFEFACTGQVYLPTLAYLVRMKHEPTALLLLVLYNLGFIAPLLAVFAAGYVGVGSKRITVFFQKHMAAVKTGLAVFFIGLAVFTLLG